MDFEGTVRLVEIDGLDLNTCGGTHLRSTAEIGALCLLGTEPMRGGTRLFFVAGDRVRRRMAAHEARNRELRSLLDTGDDELADIVRVRLTREKDLARKARTLAEELADRMAAALATRSEAVVEAHWEDRDMAFLQRVARMLVEAAPEMCGLLTATATAISCSSLLPERSRQSIRARPVREWRRLWAAAAAAAVPSSRARPGPSRTATGRSRSCAAHLREAQRSRGAIAFLPARSRLPGVISSQCGIVGWASAHHQSRIRT